MMTKPTTTTKDPPAADPMAEANDPLTVDKLFDVAAIPHVLSLAERFTLPPFTMLDGRAGWWQDRKRQWADLGLRSSEGRDARTFAQSAGTDEVSQKILALTDGQSIFDPVLCEMAYRWFVPVGGSILDPFAGGSVRGIVAAVLGRRYVGVDLSADQVAANQAQDQDFLEREIYRADQRPTWVHGDSLDVLSPSAGSPGGFDFVWSCPPYHDLEHYSDDPADLSNLPWEAFVVAYRDIIGLAVDLLAEDRFCGFVVGEIRGPDGFYRNFVQETIGAFERAGAAYYNEAFLVSPAGTLPLRAAKQFTASRKMGRTHQTVLVFCNGDPKKAAVACDPRAMEAVIGKLDEGADDLTHMDH